MKMRRKIPDIGEVAPDFEVGTADERPFRLHSALREGRNLLLTFYRGHW